MLAQNCDPKANEKEGATHFTKMVGEGTSTITLTVTKIAPFVIIESSRDIIKGELFTSVKFEKI